MKKLVTTICILMLFSMLVTCGGESSTTENNSKTTTNSENTKEVPVNPTNNVEKTKIEKDNEEVLIELKTLKNLCLFEANEDVKVDRRQYYSFGMRDFIENSTIFNKELKNRLLKPINELQNGDSYLLASKFNAVLDVEIEKHKLP